MFTYLNEIRKRAGLPLMEMTYPEAIAIFKRHGVDARHMPEKELQRARRKLDMKHHPDRGGDEEIQKDIAAAYGVIQKAGFERAAGRPSGGPQYGFRGAPPGGGYGGGQGQGTPPWQTDPRGMSNIYREDYRDVNFIKKSMWEKSGKSKQQWTIMGYDGHFFRNQVTVFGSPKIFNDMAEAMRTWQSKGGNPYETYAVFAAKGNKLNELYVIYVDGKFMGDDPYVLHSSGVPYNDQAFMRKLPEYLERIVIKDVMGDEEEMAGIHPDEPDLHRSSYEQANRAKARAEQQRKHGKRAASAYASMRSEKRPGKSYGKA